MMKSSVSTGAQSSDSFSMSSLRNFSREELRALLTEPHELFAAEDPDDTVVYYTGDNNRVFNVVIKKSNGTRYKLSFLNGMFKTQDAREIEVLDGHVKTGRISKVVKREHMAAIAQPDPVEPVAPAKRSITDMMNKPKT